MLDRALLILGPMQKDCTLAILSASCMIRASFLSDGLQGLVQAQSIGLFSKLKSSAMILICRVCCQHNAICRDTLDHQAKEHLHQLTFIVQTQSAQALQSNWSIMPVASAGLTFPCIAQVGFGWLHDLQAIARRLGSTHDTSCAVVRPCLDLGQLHRQLLARRVNGIKPVRSCLKQPFPPILCSHPLPFPRFVRTLFCCPRALTQVL